MSNEQHVIKEATNRMALWGWCRGDVCCCSSEPSHLPTYLFSSPLFPSLPSPHIWNTNKHQTKRPTQQTTKCHHKQTQTINAESSSKCPNYVFTLIFTFEKNEQEIAGKTQEEREFMEEDERHTRKRWNKGRMLLIERKNRKDRKR